TLFGIEGLPENAKTMPFVVIEQLRWSANRPEYELVGRDAEKKVLLSALEESALGHGKLINIEGETGMGKSRLCEDILHFCQSSSGDASFYRSLPAALGELCYDTLTCQYCTVESIGSRLRAPPSQLPALVIVDDIHLLSSAQQAMLASASADALQQGKLVVFAGRKIVRFPDAPPAEIIGLRRMSPQLLQGLVRKALGTGGVKNRTNKVLSICSAAAGVPLFAIELARHHREDERLPLTLQVAINARLDGLHLDRRLLREVAKHAAGISLVEASHEMGEDIATVRRQTNNSVAAGVLSCTADEWVSFTHPLLRLAINDTITD
ncbi:MAG: ATP-binding protein, partial [Actinomycetota bacterium]|nr:ATP-binding protein [Actinomycetota bacterium]